MTDTMEIPGNNGGANWGSTAVDPTTGWIYIASKEWPSMLKMEPQPPRQVNLATLPPAQAGRVLYMENCQQCHKADLTGALPEVPALTGIVAKAGAERVRSVVHDGQGQMPSFSRLAAEDTDRLMAYLTDPSSVPAGIGRGGAGRGGPPAPKLVPGNPTRYWTGYGYHECERRYAPNQAAVLCDDGLRSERRQDQMADSCGRDTGTGGARHSEYG